MPDLAELLDRWRSDLAAWAIPEHITAAAGESPWVLPREVFARRADRLGGAPSGPSYERAWTALDPPGSVLDIGAGAGAACLPLLARTTTLTAVDADDGMLGLLAARITASGRQARLVHGRWPEVAPAVAPADVVTCQHVLYNVADVGAFIEALTGHARRIVVAEMSSQHPLVSLNALWLRLHGIERPRSPAASDLVAILTAMRLHPGHQAWRRPGGADYATFAELTDVTRRRLCLPPERADEVAEALVAEGVEPGAPVDLGSSGRDVVTIWWDGAAS